MKRLGDGSSVAIGADRFWYLASATKVPIAIAVLREVDARRLRLDETLRVTDDDRVDSTGELVWAKTGTAVSIESLLERMLAVSDSVAANMLFRRIGQKAVNDIARRSMGAGRTGAITTISEVRHRVYGELHPEANRLSGPQLLEIAASEAGPQRVSAVRRALGINADDLRMSSLDEAYDRYYAGRHNAATLIGYCAMLESLVRGRLLSPDATGRLFKAMGLGRDGHRRLQAGLPEGRPFIHKTGTHHRRACHMGVIDPGDGGRRAIVVGVAIAGPEDGRESDQAFERIGTAIRRTVLAPLR